MLIVISAFKLWDFSPQQLLNPPLNTTFQVTNGAFGRDLTKFLRKEVQEAIAVIRALHRQFEPNAKKWSAVGRGFQDDLIIAGS